MDVGIEDLLTILDEAEELAHRGLRNGRRLLYAVSFAIKAPFMVSPREALHLLETVIGCPDSRGSQALTRDRSWYESLLMSIRDKILCMKARVWTRLNPETILAVVVTLVIAPVPIAWTVNSNHLLATSSVTVIHVSSPSSPYADNTYSDVEVSVDNQGNTTAEGCRVRAKGTPLSSEDPADVVTLDESERFELSPQDGRVLTMSIYLPDADGKTVGFGVVCERTRLSEAT